ncbi:MAG: sigma-70 family RNA polymerase sigma factor [Planctomycetota bacterium]|nr:MAG: sigma-70 family RNA polymerase sigma factor [Planctomycetota bacterium]REJ97343.1 MAG: sigma-70 family RNA polymerase sigma factor [Planctomycetota bacterium]REK27746.1 MAG: sigma-70 family RNA polymerase sigma factor [Planctomycetota bacterium]REK48113.1 MAG: sigma-70 family RNA polymerase sigma factor [Planctomycetota bacterium]
MVETRDTDPSRLVRDAVRRHESSLLRYAARITGDLERARDVVQDTFLKLCREDLAQLDGHLTQWLYTVCRRGAIDVCRKEQRMSTISQEQAAGVASREASQAEAAENRDTAARVAVILAELSENQQEVIRLKFQHGLSYREISAVTELSVSNVGYLIHTALGKVRQRLRVEPQP